MTEEKVNIILPPVWAGIYLNIARLLKLALKDLKIEAAIIEAGEIQDARFSIVLGWNLIPDEYIPDQPYVVYQLEPLVLPLWQEKITGKIRLFGKALAIWDYAEANIRYLAELGLKAEIVPLGYHPGLEDVTYNEIPDFDVLFVGFLTERRHKLIEQLQQQCCVAIQPRWGKDFPDALGRSKILLNIHQYDEQTPLEQPRISYALNNHSFVISEASADNPYPMLISCNYAEIIAAVLKFLYDPLKRLEMRQFGYDNFKKNEMKNIIQNCLVKLPAKLVS